MSPQQVFNAKRIERTVHLVCGNGILHLLYLSQRSYHRLAVDDVCHLSLTQFVSLYGKGGVNGFDAICLTQSQSVILFQPNGIAFHLG